MRRRLHARLTFNHLHRPQAIQHAVDERLKILRPHAPAARRFGVQTRDAVLGGEAHCAARRQLGMRPDHIRAKLQRQLARAPPQVIGGTIVADEHRQVVGDARAV